MITEKELIKFVGQVTIAYPNTFKNYTKTMFDLMKETWMDNLNDFTYEQLTLGLKKHLSDTLKGCYCPSIADIRKNVNELLHGQIITAGEAWEEVLTHIRKHGSDSIGNYNNMSKTTVKVVKQIGLRNIGLSESPDIMRAHFIKLYESYVARELNERNLQPQLREIQSIANKKMLCAGVLNKQTKNIEYRINNDFESLKNNLEKVKNII